MSLCPVDPTLQQVADSPLVAAANDIIAASTFLEEAVHAADESTTWCALANCAARLRWAQANLEMVGAEEMRDLAACAAVRVESILALGGVPLGTSLAAFQQLTLLPLHGVIADVGLIPLEERLEQQEETDEAANLAFAGVVGLFVVGVIAGSYIDWKQTHGGYARGPRGEAHDLVAWRYPPRRR